MKRLVASVVFGTLTAIVLAQAPFTVVRPVDGAKVRETVTVQIPKNSVPDTGYVGIFLNGKFIEATILEEKGRFFEYKLDTKARQIADGKYTLEVVLYADFGERPRIMDRSSVDIEVVNKSSIPIPADGLLLRYAFRPGTENVFLIEQKVQVSTITEAQARMGGRAATLQVEGEQFRMRYAVDNAYGDGDGLIRMQPLPDKGKDYAFITVNDEKRKYMFWEMHPLYMRLTNTGLEKWGSAPFYVPLEGTSGEGYRFDLYGSIPLPTLPAKRVRPGSVWQTRFQFGQLDMENLYEMTALTSRAPARGEVVGVEWEMGHPCVKIRHSIAQGTPVAQAMGRSGLGGERVSLEETVWFALDRNMVVKAVRDFTVDQRVTDGGGTPQGGGAPQGGSPDSRGGPRGNADPRGSGTRGGQEDDKRHVPTPPSIPINQGRRGGPGGGMAPEDGGPSQGGTRGGGRQGGGVAGGQRQGGPATGALRFVRTRMQFIMTLEK